ncbi:MAG: S9 family peptidase [Muribaculaceae bacterium]|nr:S9 family peptidase [Muribaculaceae bacterium]
MKLKYITAAFAASLSSVVVAAPELTLHDYCTSRPASVKAMTPLADGESYAAISDDGESIETFSYKTGKKTGVLFSLSGVKGELKIDDFDGFRLSANGKKILLWNDTKLLYRHSFTAEYYVYDIMRSTLAKVSVNGAQRDATISHDGKMVAYTRGNNIYISNVEYKTDYAVTTDGVEGKIINGSPDWGYEEEFSMIHSLRWSGDDRTLAYIRFDETDVPTYSFDEYLNYCTNDPLADMYPGSYSYKYPLAGYTTASVGVYAFNVDNRAAKKMDLPITETDYVPSIEFDGKGERLMIMIVNHDQNNLRLFSVNPDSTVGQQIYTDSSKAWLSPKAYQQVKYMDDSFVIMSDRDGHRHLYQYGYNGSLKKQLTKGDYNVTEYYGYDGKTGRHYFQSTYKGAINRNICFTDMKGGISLLNKEDGFASARFSKDFSYYLMTYQNAQTAPQYFIYNSKGVKIADIELNEKYMRKFASAPKKEFLKVKNAVGEEMNAYIIKPNDFDPSKKYPLLMYQYNGPESQQVQNRWSMDGLFYLVQEGYVVACVDGRGTGFRNTEWAYSVYKQLGVLESQDQIAGANYFATLPYIDSSRLGCFGWSYGGYMTLMELGSEKSPFKAGVAMASVTDWRFYDAIYTERYMLTPQQNAKGYEISSALNRTQNVNANLLIMSGTSDDNVHFYNTIKYASKLSNEGGIFDMMAFAEFEHSFRKCTGKEQVYRKINNFLSKNL